jgi:hypothetical protein
MASAQWATMASVALTLASVINKRRSDRWACLLGHARDIDETHWVFPNSAIIMTLSPVGTATTSDTIAHSTPRQKGATGWTLKNRKISPGSVMGSIHQQTKNGSPCPYRRMRVRDNNASCETRNFRKGARHARHRQLSAPRAPSPAGDFSGDNMPLDENCSLRFPFSEITGNDNRIFKVTQDAPPDRQCQFHGKSIQFSGRRQAIPERTRHDVRGGRDMIASADSDMEFCLGYSFMSAHSARHWSTRVLPRYLLRRFGECSDHHHGFGLSPHPSFSTKLLIDEDSKFLLCTHSCGATIVRHFLRTAESTGRLVISSRLPHLDSAEGRP